MSFRTMVSHRSLVDFPFAAFDWKKNVSCKIECKGFHSECKYHVNTNNIFNSSSLVPEN